MSVLPDNWWIPVDSDEFIFFPNDLNSEVKYNIDNNFDYTFGLLVDRISEDGNLKKLKVTDNIFSKFPLVGNVSMELKGHGTLLDKVSLVRGFCTVANGIHGVKNIEKQKISDSITQHHHFKWNSNTIKNLKKQYKGLNDNNHHWYTEYGIAIKYFENFGGIDISNSDFLLDKWNGNWVNWETLKELDISLKESDEYPLKRHIWDMSW